jgi:rSAM/selenodomain-associated transferase 2/rSAM/selenodomain-associated transferase 1
MIIPSPQLRPGELPGLAEVAVVIPVLNEEKAIGRVMSAIPAWVREVIVVDNGSTDRTAQVAREHGARVVTEPRRGYGSACLAGLAALRDPEVVVFLDGDFSDHPEEMGRLVARILENRADLVIGSRVTGDREPGALTWPQRFGNALTCGLLRLLWGARCTDLGPFRGIRHSSLVRLDMDDRGYGWTVQMQIRALKRGLRVCEVPVSYRRRIGRSKISGTIRGVLGAGGKILFNTLREALSPTVVSSRERLIVFARHPQPGVTKTRLIPALGAEGAATLQHRMTIGLLRQARRLRRRRGTQVTVRFAGGSVSQMRSEYGADLGYQPQCDGALGTRLSSAIADAFGHGSRAVVAVGTDCPALTDERLGEAFDALSGDDVVLGPARDGGYYLIGLRRPHAALFQDIAWGTDRVLEQTRHAATESGLSVRLLEVLDDVDRPKDLVNRVSPSAAPERPSPCVSVIIPALDEQESIGRAIRSAMAADDGEVEIIVVDGGSVDATAEVARSCGANVLHSERGRSAQMNAGAAAARGTVLLFLHADSHLPPDFVRHVRRTLAAPGTVAGAFALEIEPSSPGMRICASTTNLRSRALGLPYGDQAIFLTRAAFDRVGGYRDVPIMEDLDLVRRLGRLGRVRIANRTVGTSGRRWRLHGTLRTSLLNQLLVLAHFLGVAPQRLYQWRESGIILPWRSLLCGQADWMPAIHGRVPLASGRD